MPTGLVSGRDALLGANRRGLPGPLRVEYMRPDVAVAHKRARAATVDGEPIGADQSMIALYVLVKEDGRWRVAARQNTLVAPSGRPFRPRAGRA